MTQEDKELLLKDLSARLPYGVKVTWDGLYPITLTPSIYAALWKEKRDQNIPKVYLRPMSSMTEEEYKEAKTNGCIIYHDTSPKNRGIMVIASPKGIDWLNAHHFDYRGLIPKGLAIEAPEGMYKV